MLDNPALVRTVFNKIIEILWLKCVVQNDQKAKSVRALNMIARQLRARRVEAGALTLASPEVRFELDRETHNPLDVQQYDLKETNALVSSCFCACPAA